MRAKSFIISIFAAAAGFTSANSATYAPEPTEWAVSLCDVAKNPKAYFGKHIRTTIIWHTGEYGFAEAVQDSPDCLGRYVLYLPEDAQTEVGKAFFEDWNKRTSLRRSSDFVVMNLKSVLYLRENLIENTGRRRDRMLGVLRLTQSGDSNV